ncbi:MAG: hypothetical protein QOD77_187 [Thermoplasmata archaeon]|nr:hypothetical protein [Thermoplasmata archaeon]
MRAILAVTAMALLAGCTAPATDSLTTAPGEAAAEVPLAAPTLRVGDWWNFTAPGLGPFTLVVAADAGSDWVFATDDPDAAFYDLRNDISYLGPQRKSDLAGSQGTERVKFLDFPLTDNKTWTTTWDHQPVTVRATRDGDRFHLLASNATRPYVAYDYDPAVRWFTEMDFLQPDGSSFVMSLQRSGGNYTGTLAHWQLDTLVEIHGDLASTPFGSQAYQVPAGTTDVWVDAELHCTAGFAGAGTAPAPFVGSLAGTDERGAGSPGGACPADESFSGVAGDVRPDASGSEAWGYSAGGAGGAVGTIDLLILLRTLERTPLGA